MSQANPYVGRLSPDGRWRWDGERWQPVERGQAPPWARVSRRIELRAPGVVAIAAVAILGDQAIRSGEFGLAATLALAAAALGLVAMRLLTNRQAIALAAAAVVLALPLTLRASPWLLWPDIFSALGLIGVAASLSVRGSVFNLGTAEVLARIANASLHLFAPPSFVIAGRRLTGDRGRLAAALLRGVVLALPLALLVGILLASADPIFASFFRVNLDFGSILLDAMLVLLIGWLTAALLSLASAVPIDAVEGPKWRLGDVEIVVVLAILDAVFAAFAVAQVIGVSGAGAATLRASGTTYSEYARSGFFQLLAVAAITLVALAVLTSVAGGRSRARSWPILGLSEIAVLMTLLVVYVASARLSLYEQAYGFAMLRLYSHIFALWLGIVFVLLGLRIAGLASNRRWFFGAATAAGVLILLVLNVVNPEALVVHQNVQRYESSHKLDTAYLAQLSDDAVPTIVGDLPRLDAKTRASLVSMTCHGTTPARNWAAFNVAALRAAAARAQCANGLR